ncbi:MAG: type II toxin-antitoxin system VapB family antitoxin [Rhodospirillaceae bacterium]
MRTNIVLDDELIKEAQVLTGLRTKKDVVHLALTELVRSRRRKDLTELAGRVRLARDFDHKAMRELRGGAR